MLFAFSAGGSAASWKIGFVFAGQNWKFIGASGFPKVS
jgi:hypothetical protein